MKIKKYRVREFRSVWDSGDVIVDDQITCFVGENASGKTVLLKALYRTNPAGGNDPFNDRHTAFNKDNDYPKSEVDKFHDATRSDNQDGTPVVECQCELDDSDIDTISKQFGDKALTGKIFTVKAFYHKAHEFEADDIEVDDQAAREHLTRHPKLPASLKNKLTKDKDWNEFAAAFVDTGQHTEFSELLTAVNQIQQFGLLQYIIRYIVWSKTKFLYCNDYYQIQGEENLDALIRRRQGNELKKSDHPLFELLETVGLAPDKMIGSQDTTNFMNRFRKPIKKAGELVTKSINDNWSQNSHLRIEFRVQKAEQRDPEGMREGTNIWIDVYDDNSDIPTPLSSHSSGFIWFFSFLVRYEHARKNKEKLILLLDEPGLSLHGKAQADLLRYFESNFSNTQIIYTTHSPFMIDPQRPHRIRVVQNSSVDDGVQSTKEKTGDKGGTSIFTNATKVGKNSWLPLQRALGYEIQQTFLIAPNTLIVEGISDRLILTAISEKLKSESHTGLSEEWSIIHTGGIGNVRALVSLLAPQKDMNAVVLIDIQHKDKQIIDKLYADKLIEKDHVLTYASFTEKEEADVEDMFDIDFYVNLFNNAFGEKLSQKINLTDLEQESSKRTIELINGYLKKNSLNPDDFSHYVPAQHLVRNIDTVWEKISKDTKDRFEKLFCSLNRLLA